MKIAFHYPWKIKRKKIAQKRAKNIFIEKSHFVSDRTKGLKIFCFYSRDWARNMWEKQHQECYMKITALRHFREFSLCIALLRWNYNKASLSRFTLFICHHSRARLKIIRKCHNIFIAEMIPNIRASMKSKKWKRFEDIEAPQSKARECKWNFDYDDSSSRIVKCLRLQLLQHRW